VKTFHTSTLPGRKVLLRDGSEYLWFSGTDYLGMGHNESFRTFLLEGLNLYGNHYGSSRNNSLRLNVFEECEAAFSAFAGAESALLISSGMLAGQLLMKEIENIITFKEASRPIRYHYAPRVHPAIWGKDYIPASGSWNSWATSIVDLINADLENEIHIICTDAIGSPMVESFDFSVFNQIAKTGKRLADH
jgi:8-amino-7-oxononanoate synthase